MAGGGIAIASAISTLIATAIATSSAVAVAEHAPSHEASESCEQAVLRQFLDHAVALDIGATAAESADENEILTTLAWYEWYQQVASEVASGGCDGFVETRIAQLRQLDVDLAEMRALEAAAERLEAEAEHGR
ncbi:MAG: hypothetical protein AAF721_23760 [Myxococcota bacterium]